MGRTKPPGNPLDARRPAGVYSTLAGCGRGGVMAVFAANLLRNTEFLLTVGLLAVVLVAGAMVLYATDNWRKRRDTQPDDSPLTLQHYRELFEAGELTEAEYTKVRDRLAGRPPKSPPDPPA